MEVFQNLLYISGDFESNNGDVSELITFDGSKFDDFGRAFSAFGGNEIFNLTAINDNLYIGGEFSSAVASNTKNILKWDGETWFLLGDGVQGTVLSIILYGGDILPRPADNRRKILASGLNNP